MRFGLIEFAFITRFNFGQYSSHAEITKMSNSTRLRETYLNGVASPKLADLEEAFQSCEDVKDCWKFGLCYLAEAVLLVDEP